jgi:hypothetical protein
MCPPCAGHGDLVSRTCCTDVAQRARVRPGQSLRYPCASVSLSTGGHDLNAQPSAAGLPGDQHLSHVSWPMRSVAIRVIREELVEMGVIASRARGSVTELRDSTCWVAQSTICSRVGCGGQAIVRRLGSESTRTSGRIPRSQRIGSSSRWPGARLALRRTAARRPRIPVLAAARSR